MAHMPDTLRALAATGATVEVDASRHMPDTGKDVAALVRDNGGQIIVTHCTKWMPATLLEIAQIAGRRAIFRGTGE